MLSDIVKPSVVYFDESNALSIPMASADQFPQAHCDALNELGNFPSGKRQEMPAKTAQPQCHCNFQKRRGRDSNPRTLSGRRFSRPERSATLPPLQHRRRPSRDAGDTVTYPAIPAWSSYTAGEAGRPFLHELLRTRVIGIRNKNDSIPGPSVRSFSDV